MPQRSPDSTPTPDARKADPNRRAGLLEAFQNIRSQWDIQRSHWKPEVTGDLHEQLRTLAAQTEAEDLKTLAEAAFAAEVYLSSFVGLELPMTPEQQQHFHKLLEQLERLLRAEDTDAADPVPAEAQPQDAGPRLCLLGPPPAALAPVIDSLGDQGFALQRLDDPAEVIHLLHRRETDAVLAAVDSIPQMTPLIEEIALVQKNTGRRIPLIYLADNGNLETRIKATRAGGSAFFSPPLDGLALRERIDNLLASPDARNNYRVMVVEDDPAQASFAASVLSKAGMAIRTVGDPMQILDQLRDFRPHLILMDIYMPGVNGIELTSVIREYDEFASIPIVFLSGEQDTDKQVDALSVGGDDFITKPIRPRQLIAVVENRIRRSQRLFDSVSTPTHEHCALTREQFLERIASQLSIDPMRTQAHAVLLLQPDGLHALKGMDGLADLVTGLEERVAGQLDTDDALARLDDETLAVLVRRPNTNPIHDLCSRLHETVSRQPLPLCGKPLKLTIGIGVALAHRGGDEAPDLIEHAGLALRLALANGPGRTVTHDESLEEQLADSIEASGDTALDIAQLVRNALKNDGLRLLFQPMLDLVDNAAETWELQPQLVTGSDTMQPLHGLRREIEHAGLTEAIDAWLFDKALDILKQRRNDGHKTFLFVPQAVSSLLAPDFPERVSEALRNRRMVGTGLVLQYRLSALSNDLKAAKQAIKRIREMDIRVCLSRFAEKPAAFKVLRYVRGNFVRIAPRLLKADRETIATVIRETHRARARVVVPDIDDPHAIDLNWSTGADLLQGDFIQPASETMEYDFTQVVI